jgi:hypothetical protein
MRPATLARIAVPLLAAVTIAGTVTGAASPPARAETATEFRPAATPWFWPRSGLQAVSASGPDDVWAVGYQGYQAVDWSIPGFGAGTIQVLPPKAAMARWNGRTWQGFDPPGFGAHGKLFEVDAASPEDAWITGGIWHSPEEAEPYLGRWDGTRWHRVQPPEGCGLSMPAADTEGAWFVCGRDLARWEDGEWTLNDTGSPDRCCIQIHQFSVVSQKSIWVAATWGLLHWDGERWTAVPEFEGVITTSVVASSDTDVRATGYKYIDGANRPIDLRWDGERWHSFPDAPGRTLLRDGGGALWSYSALTYGDPYRLDGDTWTQVPLAEVAPRPTTQLETMAAIPGSEALWIVGATKDVPVVLTNG